MDHHLKPLNSLDAKKGPMTHDNAGFCPCVKRQSLKQEASPRFHWRRDVPQSVRGTWEMDLRKG